MSDAYGNLIPTRWILPNWAQTYQQEVIVNWLEVELSQDRLKPRQKVVLEGLKGWRNREVYYYIQDWDWTERMYR
mgnify:FL=1